MVSQILGIAGTSRNSAEHSQEQIELMITMTEDYVVDVSSLLANPEPLTDEAFKKLLDTVRSGAREREQYGDDLSQALANDEKKLAGDANKAMKVAQLLHVLGQHKSAVTWFDKAGSSAQQLYLKGMTFRQLKQFDQAIECFEQADKKGQHFIQCRKNFLLKLQVLGNSLNDNINFF